MANLILFLLSTIGITNILIYGAIFDGPREWLKNRVPTKVNELMSCYQCMGTWVGFLAGYILLTHDPFGVLMCGGAGSFAAHFAAILVEYLEANSMVSLPPETDDLGSLQRQAEDFEMPPYPYQFVQNESLEASSETEIVSFPPISHTPILKHTVTGTVYRDDHAIQIFTEKADGTFGFAAIGTPEFRAVGSTLDRDTGELVLEFNKPVPGTVKVILSYEYIA